MLGVIGGSQGDVEVDEVYVSAGLKGRGNHSRIILLGRGPRCRGLRAGRVGVDGIRTLSQYSQ